MPVKNAKWSVSDTAVHNERYVALVQQYGHEEWGEALQHCALEVLQDLLDENGEYRKHLQKNIIRVVRKLQRLPNKHEYTSLMRHVLVTAIVYMVVQGNGVTRGMLQNLTGVSDVAISMNVKRIREGFEAVRNQRVP